MLSRTSCLGHKNGRFAFEPSVLCSALGKMAGGQKGNCSAVDFLLRGRFARESWRAGAADTGRDKAEEGGIPAAVFRPTTTQDVPASVRLRACASRAYRPVFLLKRKEGVRFLFLKKRNKRHCGIDGLSEKRCFPARPARNEKTDGSHTNRPFCGAGWRKQQKRRKEAQPQTIFFCFFSSKKKRRPLVASNAAFHYTIFISTNHGDAHACQCRCAGSRASPNICFIR